MQYVKTKYLSVLYINVWVQISQAVHYGIFGYISSMDCIMIWFCMYWQFEKGCVYCIINLHACCSMNTYHSY